jgi:transketolase
MDATRTHTYHRGTRMSIEQDRRTVEAWQAIVNNTDGPVVITLSRATLRRIVDIAAQAVEGNP